MSTDLTRSIVVDHRVHSDIIRRSMTGPSGYSMEDREAIAKAVISDMLGYDSNATGQPCTELNILRDSDDWTYLRDVSNTNGTLFSFIAASVISDIVRNGDNALSALRADVEAVTETVGILESVFPGDDFERYVDEIFSELLFDRFRYAELIEKRDILGWIGETVRFLESDLHGAEGVRSNNHRNVRILIDTSKPMFGEPEVISKALMLSLSKRMLSENRNVHVTYYADEKETTFELNDKKGFTQWFLGILTYRFRSSSDMNMLLDNAVAHMRQNDWKGSDVIMISKGLGVRNSMRFTGDWSTFRMFNDIRTFSLAAGAVDVKGLTELSDRIYAMNSKGITEKSGEYARFIADMKTYGSD